MATGAGKTKVLSLLMAWSYFHKLYEPDSDAVPQLPVDRAEHHRAGSAPGGFRWTADLLQRSHSSRQRSSTAATGATIFRSRLHIQDDVRIVRETGNIFLTNIHRVYLGDVSNRPSRMTICSDYFLDPFGPKPVGKTTDSKIDLGEIVREIDELAVFNDEAHHIHDPRMAWFKSIQDIHHRMLQKDRRLRCRST